jgi:hypothetical protein
MNIPNISQAAQEAILQSMLLAALAMGLIAIVKSLPKE